MTRSVSSLGSAIAAAAILGSPDLPSGMGEPYRFLRTVGGFSAGDFAGLERGEAVARILDTDKREVAVVGAVRIVAPRERLLDRYRDVSSLRNSDIVLQVGTFSAVPSAEDLRGLTFEDYDLQTLRDCEPGDCGVRLSAEEMQRFKQGVNWRAEDWRRQAGTVWRSVLAQYAVDYLANGSGALAVYRNKQVPLSVAEEFGALFEESKYFSGLAPDFFRYLQEYPRAHLDGSQDILYWSKDSFGLRPVISLTHLTLYAPVAESALARPPAFVATKQIYATHYFDAALGLTIALDDGRSGFYMVCVNRARTRSLMSFTRGLVRAIVQRRSRDGMESILRSTKAGLERRPSAL